MPFVTVDGSEFHYEIAGQGPPLILVTGLAGVGSYWDGNVAGLARHFTVIRYDHRGTGRSARTEGAYSIELLTADLVGLMAALGIANASIVGHSTGGAIGQILAAKHPELVDRMVLYGSWSTLCQQMRICMEMRLDLLNAYGVEAYHKASPLFLYPPRFVCDHWPTLASGIETAVANSTSETILAARAEAVMRHDGSPYLSRITAPTLVLVARDDILTPLNASEELARGVPGATLQVLPYGAHAASVCEPQAFNNAVLSFLLNRDAREEIQAQQAIVG